MRKQKLIFGGLVIAAAAVVGRRMYEVAKFRSGEEKKQEVIEIEIEKSEK